MSACLGTVDRISKVCKTAFPVAPSLSGVLADCARARAGSADAVSRKSFAISGLLYSQLAWLRALAIRASTTPTRCSRGIGSPALGCEVNRCCLNQLSMSRLSIAAGFGGSPCRAPDSLGNICTLKYHALPNSRCAISLPVGSSVVEGVLYNVGIFMSLPHTSLGSALQAL